MNPLQTRLAAVRRFLRFIVTLRGVCWLVSLLLAIAIGVGLLDWKVHLPALIRAVLLSAGLVAAVNVAWRFLLRPLLARADDLSMALKIESRHPALTDVVASAVQFLEEPAASSRTGSSELRSHAVKRALAACQGVDFRQVVDTRGLQWAGLSLLTAGGLALGLLLLFPGLAWTGILRLASPFGNHEWPRQTQLTVQVRERAARGESLEIHATVSGVVPERAVIEYQFESGQPLVQTIELKGAGQAKPVSFTARLEAGRVLQTLRFKVQANDALSGWHQVIVQPPPQLVSLDGRPTPQAHLIYPAYTDIAPGDAPAGASSIEAVVGTQIRLVAATDRPLSRAWLEFPGDLQVSLALAGHLGALGRDGAFAAAVHHAVAQSPLSKRIPAQLEADNQVLTLDLIARVRGSYVLHLEDETGLSSTRLLEILVSSDPQPTVHLERPSQAHDVLEVLPDADITLNVLAEDPVYALRSVYVEYRQGRGTAAVASPRKLALYDEAIGRIAPVLASGLARSGLELPPMRLRPTRLPLQRRWSLAPLGLREGDALVLQACAEDFDDVTACKPPGRSTEIELRIVGRTALDSALNEGQARIQQELVRLEKQQQEALDKVDGAEAQWRNRGGKLDAAALDDITQAEQLQQQIRARIGTKEEGLRAEVARLQQSLRDNKLPRSSTADRMETIGSELDRLAENELPRIEPRLTDARKHQERDSKAEAKPERSPLGVARGHQSEVRTTLETLLKMLEPWSSSRELKGEARALLQQQRKVAEDTANLPKEKGLESGVPPQELDPRHRAELERLAELQKKLAGRAGRLLSTLGNLAESRQKTDPENAQALADAAKEGEKNGVEGAMKDAEKGIRDNQLGKAAAKQAESSKGMERIVQALEERREQELDRLVKKLRQAEQKLGELTQRQEELQKKMREAAQLGDPEKREQELRRLAREQEKLGEETQEMVRELTRLRASRAGQSLSQAGGQMRQAGRQMSGGEDAEQQQEDALDRLDDAQRELQEARADAEEELAREKLVKIADLLKGLRERQESRQTEAARIQRELLQQKGWRRPLLSSMRELARAQADLGREAKLLAEEKLEQAAVFAHLLIKAADGMEQAGDRVLERLEQAQSQLEAQPEGEAKLDLAGEQSADEEIQRHQKSALRRLDQLMDSMKPGNPGAARPASPPAGEGAKPGQGAGGGQSPGGEGFPTSSQLKALRALQLDVNERTERFARQHPDQKLLDDRARAELDALKQEQQEVADLFEQLTARPEPEGDKK